MSESNSFFTPQVIAIIVGAAVAIWYLTRSSSDESQSSDRDLESVEKLERLPVGKLTLEQLQKFNGENNSRIFVSVCGRVFDLTKGRDFYGYPDGPYNCFVGGDASYMLGAMSLEKTNLNKRDFEQDGDHQITLTDWICRFRAKYPIVGRLEGFADSCPESWREAGNDDIIDVNIDLNNIYSNDFRVLTSEELSECSKYDNEHSWLSVCGIIFDVKSAEIVYESMYGDFPDAIGNDISVALANNKFGKEMYNKSINEDNENGKDKQKLFALKKYLKLFAESYPIVGFLKDDENKYRLNNVGDISPKWEIVDQNEADDKQPQPNNNEDAKQDKE